MAADLHEDRLARLRTNLERLQLSHVKTVRADVSEAASLRSALGKQGFDRVLLDVPCTNTGVLRRRADARWRFSERRLAQLAGLQRRMLDGVAEVLEPGGILVYSTCSLEPEEGTQRVASWLKDREGFELVREVTTFPPDDDTDGIYAAALRRC